MRIAALDLGSNSFHLLVCEARLDGSFTPLAREKEMLRLGDQVAREGRIGPAAAARAIETIGRFKRIADANHVDELIALGTAAIREAQDGVEFVDRVREETGVRIEAVDGVVEARLIFRAVRSSVLMSSPRPGVMGLSRPGQGTTGPPRKAKAEVPVQTALGSWKQAHGRYGWWPPESARRRHMPRIICAPRFSLS